MTERTLAAGGELGGGSNVGKGQMKAADYGIVLDVSNRNRNAGDTNIGAVMTAFIPHGHGEALGGLSLKSKSADVVLTLIDVRSTEQVALEQGHAKRLTWAGGAGGSGFLGPFIAGGASSYANTEIGQVIMQAYLDAFTKLVADIRGISPYTSTDNAAQAVTMSKPGKLRTQPDLKSDVVRDLEPGMTLYPTGEKMGVWWKTI
jgi:curli biogenesis system outer membrane secretion channel CsgG